MACGTRVIFPRSDRQHRSGRLDPLDAEALAGAIAATLNDVAGTALRTGPAAGGTLLMGSDSAQHSGCLLPAGANVTDVIMG
jgi:hypothetical protein